jgi:hypothetical protein
MNATLQAETATHSPLTGKTARDVMTQPQPHPGAAGVL